MKKFNDNKWMQLAISEAKLAKNISEVPVGAVLVDIGKDKLISKSRNKMIRRKSPISHAEIEVILEGIDICKSRYLNDTAIYVTLEPCLMCAAAISESRIQKIYFGAYDKKKGSIENNVIIFDNRNYYKPEIYGGIMEKECSKLLTNFFQKIRKNKKL